MKVNLISIGNSKGVRIPRSIIKACGFGEQVEMRVREGAVVLTSARDLREGWNTAFEKMAAVGDDALLFPENMAHEWDEAEWEW